MVAGVGLPAVRGGDRRSRPAGVARVHRDQAEVRCEFDRRVERRWAPLAAPVLDGRIQAARREQQHWIPGAVLLVIQGHVVVLEHGHRSTSTLSRSASARKYAMPRRRQASSGIPVAWEVGGVLEGAMTPIPAWPRTPYWLANTELGGMLVSVFTTVEPDRKVTVGMAVVGDGLYTT